MNQQKSLAERIGEVGTILGHSNERLDRILAALRGPSQEKVGGPIAAPDTLMGRLSDTHASATRLTARLEELEGLLTVKSAEQHVGTNGATNGIPNGVMPKRRGRKPGTKNKPKVGRDQLQSAGQTAEMVPA